MEKFSGKFRRILLLFLWTIVIFGCHKNDSFTPIVLERTGNRTVFAVITNGNRENGKLLEVGAKKAAEENNIQLVWLEPRDENDSEQQISLLNQVIDRRVDGIIISPHDIFSVQKSLQRAKEQGISLLFFDTDLKSEQNEIPIVTSDDFSAGKFAADQMAKILHQKGKIVVLRYSSLSASSLKREDGFLEQIKNYPEMEVVNSEYYAGTSDSVAQNKAENLLRLFLRGKEPKIDGIFVSHEQSGTNMLAALKTMELAGKIRLITFGTAPELVSGVLSLDADALIMPRKVYTGYAAVETLVKQHRGEEIPQFTDVGSDIITLQNYADPYTEAVLTPLKHADLLITKILAEKHETETASKAMENDKAM